jgi:hypothetical protein
MARAALTCLLVLALAPAVASARARPEPTLWATVNVCDTARHPHAIGVRASMPGAVRRQVRLFMRFRIQWRDPADRKWHNLLQGGDSGFVSLGSSRDARQTGQIFRYQAPERGTRQRLRGSVEFQWRIGRRVVRRETRLTTGGHPSAVGSDPRNHSAATCTLAG